MRLQASNTNISKLNTLQKMDNITSKNWVLDHVAHAVKSLQDGINFYTQNFAFKLQSREVLKEFQVEVAFLSMGESLANHARLELICPMTNNKSLKSFIEKRGEAIHHVGFVVPRIIDELRNLKNMGIELIDESPRKGAENALVAFIHPRSTHGALIELMEKNV
jgi:methylmalonyl-CoA/ethylmalonyl-CoA epimerase